MLLKELVENYNNEYGDKTCIPGMEYGTHSQRLHTGIFSLDWALCGGLPFNQISCFKGPEAGGKTTAAMSTAAMASTLCWRCKKIQCECSKKPLKMKTVWLDVEGAFDKEWAACVGLSEDDYVIVVAEDMEQYSEIAVAAIKAEDVGLVVVDSIAALMPSRIGDGTAYDNYMGVVPRAVKEFVLRMNNALIKEGCSGHDVVAIVTNQVMMDVRNMFKPETMPGGHALKHFSSLWVRFSKKALTETEKKHKDESRMMQLVQRHSFLVERHKVTILAGGGEFVRCKEPIRDTEGAVEYKKGELLEYNTVLKQAKKYGVLMQEGSKWRAMDTVGTQKEIVSLWKKNQNVYQKVQQEIIKAAEAEILNA